MRAQGIDEPASNDNTWEKAETDGKDGMHKQKRRAGLAPASLQHHRIHADGDLADNTQLCGFS